MKAVQIGTWFMRRRSVVGVGGTVVLASFAAPANAAFISHPMEILTNLRASSVNGGTQGRGGSDEHYLVTAGVSGYTQASSDVLRRPDAIISSIQSDAWGFDEPHAAGAYAYVGTYIWFTVDAPMQVKLEYQQYRTTVGIIQAMTSSITFKNYTTNTGMFFTDAMGDGAFIFDAVPGQYYELYSYHHNSVTGLGNWAGPGAATSYAIVSLTENTIPTPGIAAAWGMSGMLAARRRRRTS